MTSVFFDSTPARSKSMVRSGLGRAVISIVAAIGLLLIGSLTSAPAWAHNTLQATDPADGDSLDEAPEEIVLTFDDKVLELGNAISAVNPDGDDVIDGEPVVDNNTVTQALSGELPAGDYEVIWRVTSADGHPIDGEFNFSTENPVGGEKAPEPTEEPSDEATKETAEDAGESDEVTPTEEQPTEATATDDAEDTDDAEESSSNTTRNIIIALVILLVLGAAIALLARKGKNKDTQDGEDGPANSEGQDGLDA